MYRVGDDLVDLLDTPGSLAAGIGQGLDLCRDGCESLSRLSGPHGFHGGVQGNQVRGGGDRHNVFGQFGHLIHALAVFNGLFQHLQDIGCLLLNHFRVGLSRCLHLIRPCLHGGGILRDGAAFFRHVMDILLDARHAAIDILGILRHLLNRRGQRACQGRKRSRAPPGRAGVLQHLPCDLVQLLRTVLKGIHRPLDRCYHIFFDDPDGREH